MEQYINFDCFDDGVDISLDGRVDGISDGKILHNWW